MFQDPTRIPVKTKRGGHLIPGFKTAICSNILQIQCYNLDWCLWEILTTEGRCLGVDDPASSRPIVLADTLDFFSTAE